ncbi:MAG: hypothetical protein NZ898_13060 [Myxococcota bacterium]|nr:hypothetical protein [Myxococcota bacterium]MDW8363682.1 hypothetical protein [Myxococcales bacterium]
MTRRGLVAWLVLEVAACGASRPAARIAGASDRAAVGAPSDATDASTESGGETTGAAPARPSLPVPVLSTRLRAALDELAERVARVRGLAWRRLPDVEIEDAATIARRLRTLIPPDELERARATYVALGLLPSDVDVFALVAEVAAEQVVGYWDHKNDRLVIRNDVAAELSRGQGSPEARMTLAHELAHALQDQHLGLDAALAPDLDSDVSSAYRSLVEGDASLVMLAVLAEQSGVGLDLLVGQQVTLEQAIEQLRNARSSRLGDAPAVVRYAFLVPYVHGLGLAARLYRKGGFAAVDAAFRTPPRSMEQVLDPERYLAGERPERVELPDVAALREAGWSAVHDDTLGQVDLALYLGQRSASELDLAGARGWAGDRVRIYRHGDGSLAAVWNLRADRVADATRIAEALRETHRRLPAAVTASPPRVEHVGRDVLLVRGLDAALASSVVDAWRADRRAARRSAR